MRDLAVILVVLASIPATLRAPWIGVVTWTWLGLMNPHRLTWGYAYDLPFAQVVAIATLIGLLVSGERKSVPGHWITWVWSLFLVGMSVSTLLALDVDPAAARWTAVMKIQLFAFVTMALIRDRRQLNALVWIIVISLGFYGLKGGLFAFRVGGAERVWGPPGSFIEDNNALAVALLMTLPLMRYCITIAGQRYVRWILVGTMAVSGLAVLSSQSRGALIAGASMLLWLVLKSKHRIRALIAAACIVPLFLAFMPQTWWDRMHTLETYQEDYSAMGRLTAWDFATRIALARPTGGGFDCFNEASYREFAPDIAKDVDDRDGRFQGAHSIYFQILGEHGFVCLGLFITMLLGALALGGRVRGRCAKRLDLEWAHELSGMLQVSLISYAIGGAFLNLGYFDLYYTIVAMILVLNRLTNELLATSAAPAVAIAHSNGLPVFADTGSARQA